MKEPSANLEPKGMNMMTPIQLPERVWLANLPTPIHEMNSRFPSRKNVNLYIKRDDFTGSECSGNKIRKLEYILPKVLKENCNILITCGGVQSNHCRSTAAMAARLGLQCHLVLKGDISSEIQGNYFMDQMLGAKITFISEDEYRNNRQEIMSDLKTQYSLNGHNAYVIPEGASTGLGMFGYFNAFMEILDQEKALGITFDQICIACGSAGTYAGLYLANEITKAQKKIIGINIYDKGKDFDTLIKNIVQEGLSFTENHDLNDLIDYSHIHMVQGYVEGGYGVSTLEEIAFIKAFAIKEGIILDPVYTGKGMHALFSEIEKPNSIFEGNILFIHTGGLFGAFSKNHAFEL